MYKQATITSILLVFSFCLFAQKKIKTVKKIEIDERSYKEKFYVQEKKQNIKEGKYKQYFQENLVTEGQYSNNKKTGEWSYYNLEEIMMKGTFINGEKNGIWTYFRNNNKVTDVFYTNSNKDSAFAYSENGRIASKTIFTPKGNTSESYYTNGNIKEQRTSFKGNSFVKLFFINGVLHRHLTIEDDYPFNDLVLVDFSGKPIEKGKITKGNGTFISYKIDSLNQLLPAVTCDFINGKPEGTYYSEHRNKTTEKGLCKNGYKIGNWEELKDNGTIKNIEYKESDKNEVYIYVSSDLEYNAVFTIVEYMPEFPGKEQALFKFLGNNMRYPNEAKDGNIQGTVYVSFVIDSDGKPKDAKIIRGVHASLNEESLRVVKLMPNWYPGIQRGVPVNVQYNLPIKFVLK